MKTVVDVDTIEKNGLTLDEFILTMVIGNQIDLFEAAATLKRKRLAWERDDPPFNIAPTQRLYTKYEDIILEASDTLDNGPKYIKLAGRLIDIYPKGLKDDKYQWAEGPLLIAKRLKMFELKYGKYSDEDIIDATQKYVDIMMGRPEMRLLKYFIFKEKKNGKGEYESYSDLYTMLSNKEGTLFEAEDWITE